MGNDFGGAIVKVSGSGTESARRIPVASAMKLVIGPTSSITAAPDLVPAIPYEERPVADIDRWVMPWLPISSRGFAARYSVTAGFFATVCSETLSPGPVHASNSGRVVTPLLSGHHTRRRSTRMPSLR
ncbi:hypothetical protein [Rhodococcus wratislaviensis]|uniref:hypothetical protein n=1 Tax=Rhodococcus wratislaviensis TaxID=44752 RepID=UPI0012DE4AB9|nr:hypothetical protein [Rhodococcus wratislaviensis]